GAGSVVRNSGPRLADEPLNQFRPPHRGLRHRVQTITVNTSVDGIEFGCSLGGEGRRCAVTVRRPGPDDLRAIAQRFHFTIPDDQMPAFEALLEGFLAPYDRLDELAEPRRESRYP